MYPKELLKDIAILKIFTGSALSNRKQQSESYHKRHLTLMNIEHKTLSEYFTCKR